MFRAKSLSKNLVSLVWQGTRFYTFDPVNGCVDLTLVKIGWTRVIFLNKDDVVYHHITVVVHTFCEYISIFLTVYRWHYTMDPIISHIVSIKSNTLDISFYLWWSTQRETEKSWEKRNTQRVRVFPSTSVRVGENVQTYRYYWVKTGHTVFVFNYIPLRSFLEGVRVLSVISSLREDGTWRKGWRMETINLMTVRRVVVLFCLIS